MRSQREILNQVDLYKEKLLIAIEEKALYDDQPDLDLMILSLIDKLETLFWVLEMDLPGHDLWEKLQKVSH